MHVFSTHKGVNYRSKYVTQTQQQRPESPTVTPAWHVYKYKVHKLHKRYILKNDILQMLLYIHREHKERGVQDGHLDFHTPPEL